MEDTTISEMTSKEPIDPPQIAMDTPTENNVPQIAIDVTSESKCTRCGRSNHALPKCYAKTDVLGNKLDTATATTTNNKKKLDITEKKYIRFQKNGKWITIPNKKYIGSKTKTDTSSDNYGLVSYISTCAIL
uniref:Uncharacterized protein n=1 Tax=viral metagenome TaxID=1070528 RepID=A0A6C0CBE2_9ZZZZ